jgi:hypothetical protein
MTEYQPHATYARRLTPNVIELLAPMTLDAIAVAWIAKDAHELGRAESWFLDATMVDSMSFEVVPIIMRAVEYAKTYDGLKQFVIVLPNAFHRLALQGQAEQAPVKTIVVEFREEGLTVLGL